mmetsp:Transcript_75544/g.125972  ORF Transcript_75544/g.125972 Transcript_75544/m.125972 type:complete len:261 (-) Transcript_75544:151-933(-)|eukprot:CAMPEP_0119316154 /NCGR_PEP_ID=MMETSP1333-20130426/38769_1 /TAXON_ID=418940 /ORGANISM="Scyphosphaera apsteinii, Strain RCC1455" /LENGTH=260 /DNA_ID=CAMNT_0007321731 /DNA_START=16 /DNA_END=798 /DNA_ORIENTATION=-
MKRKADDMGEAGTSNEAKYRCAIDTLAEEFVCPITQELPLDPVTAEDGRVYERQAIVSWLERADKEGETRSPLTNTPMGRRLLPAVQVRNNIEEMVRSGALLGSKANAWNQRLKDEQEVSAIKQKAEDGDVQSMLLLTRWHVLGRKGLEKDGKQSLHWLKRAAGLGEPTALALLGVAYQSGEDVAPNPSYAAVCYARAAAAGSAIGCFKLGMAFSMGRLALPKDLKEAQMWLRKVPSCAIQDGSKTLLEAADSWLREHNI